MRHHHNLSARLQEHRSSEGNRKTFAGRYNCYFLVYYEGFDFVQDAIKREKEVKKWNRTKKELLIDTLNPGWGFLNDDLSFDHKGKMKIVFHRSEVSQSLNILSK